MKTALNAGRRIPLGTLAILGFVLVFLAGTMELGSVARLVPEKVVLCTLVLVLVQMLIDLFPALAEKAGMERMEEDRFITEKNAGPPDAPAAETSGRGCGAKTACLWIVAVPALVWVFGMMPSVLFYTFHFLRRKGNTRLLPALAAASALCAFFYLVFNRLLGVPLYNGLLWAGFGL